LRTETIEHHLSHDPSSLVGAVRRVLTDQSHSNIALIVESAWLPVTLVDTGDALWRPGEVEGLVRHRFETVYAGNETRIDEWELRVDYRVGERFALGYGLPREVSQAFSSVAETLGITWDFVSPALAWGLPQVRRLKGGHEMARWIAWPEQDRCLLACVRGNEVVALNPAVTASMSGAVIERRIAIEGARTGAGAGDAPIVVAHWNSAPNAPRQTGRLHWLNLATWREVEQLGPSRIPGWKKVA
jgi:hypothetical protein